MPRPPRHDFAEMIYHVMNRSVAKQQVFSSDSDYYDFIDAIKRAQEISPVKIYSYCIMPNHWHFLISPYEDGGVGRFIHALTSIHTKCFRIKTKTLGYGPIYKGRYKSILVNSDKYFVTLIRYIERNAVRARLAEKPSDWIFCSAWLRLNNSKFKNKILTDIPKEIEEDYGSIASFVNFEEDEDILEEIRKSLY